MKKTSVLLVDDHCLVRTGFRFLLNKIPFIEVVAEATDGRKAIELTRLHRPEIVLMDIAMPGLNGLDALARIKKEFPKTKVIILSMHATQEYVIQALRAGAAGYILKDAAVNELELALKTAENNTPYLGFSISREAILVYLERLGQRRDSVELLTSRQREILQLLAEGMATKEIAYELKISPKTVETHRVQIMERLRIRNLAGLVRYAIRAGLISSDR